eukprot:16183170-Heterocapsa_arctica.AAC.1
MRIGGRGIPLFERNDLFYIPVRLAGEQWSNDVEQQVQRAAAGVMPAVDSVVDGASSWRFYEYCCSSDS